MKIQSWWLFGLYVTSCHAGAWLHSPSSKVALPNIKAPTAGKKPTSDYLETHVPFTIQNGDITVDATINGKQFPCIVDTGTSDIVWPQRLNLKGARRYSLAGQKRERGIRYWIEGPTGYRAVGKLVRLPVIKIGEYQLRNTDSVCLPHFEDQDSQRIVLGNKAFDKVILTIDYQKRQLIIRTGNYKPRHMGHSPNCYVFNSTWVGGTYFSPGRLTIPVYIETHPCRFILDTGLRDVLLSKLLADRFLPHQPRRYATMVGCFAKPILVESISEVTISVGRAKLPGQKVIAVPHLQVNADGSVGTAILKSYRVTIDYPHQKIVLEPYF